MYVPIYLYERGEMNRTKSLRKRYQEFAGMLKKAKSGTQDKLEKLVGKMAVQEGLKEDRVWEYVETFKKAGLLTFLQGHKKWKYHPEAEWELFKINI